MVEQPLWDLKEGAQIVGEDFERDTGKKDCINMPSITAETVWNSSSSHETIASLRSHQVLCSWTAGPC